MVAMRQHGCRKTDLRKKKMMKQMQMGVPLVVAAIFLTSIANADTPSMMGSDSDALQRIADVLEDAHDKAEKRRAEASVQVLHSEKADLGVRRGFALPPASSTPHITGAQGEKSKSGNNVSAKKLELQVKIVFLAMTFANVERGSAGLGSIWPQSGKSELSNDADIADTSFKNSTEYFNALLDLKNYGKESWAPYIAKVTPDMVFRGDGKIAMWSIAENIKENTNDMTPLLISSNFDCSLLRSMWNGTDNADDVIPIFGNCIIIVRKNGEVVCLPADKVTLKNIYAGKQYDSKVSDLSYLTPNGRVFARNENAPLVKELLKERENVRQQVDEVLAAKMQASGIVPKTVVPAQSSSDKKLDTLLGWKLGSESMTGSREDYSFPSGTVYKRDVEPQISFCGLNYCTLYVYGKREGKGVVVRINASSNDGSKDNYLRVVNAIEDAYKGVVGFKSCAQSAYKHYFSLGSNIMEVRVSSGFLFLDLYDNNFVDFEKRSRMAGAEATRIEREQKIKRENELMKSAF